MNGASSSKPTTYGFIGKFILAACSRIITNVEAGLGQMGHGMAKNIRLKVPEFSLLVVYDVSRPAMERFEKEFEGHNVKAASSPKEVAEHAVKFPNAHMTADFTVQFILTSLPPGYYYDLRSSGGPCT